MQTTELVKSLSIDNLVNQRESVRASLLAAREALKSADAIVRAISEGYSGSRLYGGAASLVCDSGYVHGFRLLDDDGVSVAMKRFDAQAWQQLMHASGLRSLMDATAREKWDKAIVAGDVPELTKANILASFDMLFASRAEMFERGVIACFKSLAWDYKTNLPQKFGKRIVVTYLTGYHSHRKCDELDDLVRVLRVLDGKPEPDHRHGTFSMLLASGLSCGARRGECENDYLHLRAFKNGNGHVTFKRLDLVERMNRIIAKHFPGCLPEPK